MNSVLVFICVFLRVQVYANFIVEEEWNNFQIKFSKSYSSVIEAKRRYAIFVDNLKKIEEHNTRFENDEVSYTKGINKFADWTSEEFLDYINQYKIPKRLEAPIEIFESTSNLSAADSVDWRTKGCITKVKDQGSCGSCWAFSTTGSLEAHLFLAKGKLISLSEQNLVDCSWEQGNAGCGGGLMRSAFDYIQQNGCESEDDYPYQGYDGSCRFEKKKSVVAISGYVVINKNEKDLQEALATVGPISIGIDATEELQLYSSGILEDDMCNMYSLNHGVVLVGYGSENGKDFYIIKNSWGAAWGEKGFFRLGNRGTNPCGIMQDACYPKII